MNASRKPSIATEVHASHERPHRLAVLATSPVATGEAEIGEPRKGTETKRKQSPPLSSSLISKPYPRKGTETFFQKSVTFVKPADFKTISPQGDGNITCSLIYYNCDNFKTISPQGDGNHPCAKSV